MRSIAEGEWFADEFRCAAIDVMLEVIQSEDRWDEAERWFELWQVIDVSDPLIGSSALASGIAGGERRADCLQSVDQALRDGRPPARHGKDEPLAR